MEPITLLFGIACLITLALSTQCKGEDRGDAVFLALVCLIGWIASTVAWHVARLDSLPILDLVIAIFSLEVARRNPTNWRIVFLWFAVVQLFAHGAFDLLGNSYLIVYIHVLNATFAAQLLTIAATGGRNAWSNCRSRILRLGLAHYFSKARS